MYTVLLLASIINILPLALETVFWRILTSWISVPFRCCSCCCPWRPRVVRWSYILTGSALLLLPLTHLRDSSALSVIKIKNEINKTPTCLLMIPKRKLRSRATSFRLLNMCMSPKFSGISYGNAPIHLFHHRKSKLS